jgi:GNAT superfamily N-acetyltransferase
METVVIKEINHKLTWPIRHEVMYPDLPLKAVILDDEEEGVHFGLYVDEQLTSIVSLFCQEDIFQFRKFATIEKAQGGGYGSALLQHIIQYAKDQGGSNIWCNSRLSASGFYEQFGFKITGEYFTKNTIDFVKMELNLTDS